MLAGSDGANAFQFDWLSQGLAVGGPVRTTMYRLTVASRRTRQIFPPATRQRKLAIEHGALKSLDMPAMTMVF